MARSYGKDRPWGSNAGYGRGNPTLSPGPERPVRPDGGPAAAVTD